MQRRDWSHVRIEHDRRLPDGYAMPDGYGRVEWFVPAILAVVVVRVVWQGHGWLWAGAAALIIGRGVVEIWHWVFRRRSANVITGALAKAPYCSTTSLVGGHLPDGSVEYGAVGLYADALVFQSNGLLRRVPVDEISTIRWRRVRPWLLLEIELESERVMALVLSRRFRASLKQALTRGV
jgi:hypothetical protein